MSYKYTDDDYCDLYPNKICDNCGKCLEKDGIDTKAIKIEDITKTVEENAFLEEEYQKELKALNEVKENDLSEEFSNWDNIEMDDDLEDEEYEDAFDHIEYIDTDLNDEEILEEETIEIFPGVRKLKKI